jgi:large subunit ribosomal protein L3
MRTGVITQKVGMMRLFTDDGRHVPVTVLKLDGCQVVAQRTVEKDGYTAVQVGYGEQLERRIKRAKMGHLKRWSGAPK